jgi:hypothetical protein
MKSLAWGAEVFAKRGSLARYSSSGFALRLHSTDLALMQELLSSFGGSVSEVSGTWQWRLTGEEMRIFLEGIRELVAPEFRELAEEALSRYRAPAAERAEPAAASLPPELRRPDEEVFGRVPPPPWEDCVLFELAKESEEELLLQAESEEQAAAFAEAARARGLRTEHAGSWVRLRGVGGVTPSDSTS